jgi:carboxypeptidase family protein
MGRMWLVSLLLGSWVCGGAAAEACSCGPRSATCGPPQDYWQVGAVFAGRVTAIDRLAESTPPTAGRRRVRFHVIEKFRGGVAGPGGDVVVYTDAAAVCGYPFRVGKEYFVYAVRQHEGRLVTSTCSRTAPLDRSAADLAYARRAVNGAPPPGRIVGQVREAADGRGRVRLLSGVTVTIARQGMFQAASTDAWGQYSIEPASAGTYVLNVQLPETQFTPQAGQRIEFSTPHTCAEVNIDVLYDGRVTGRVVDSMGRGVPGFTVSYSRSSPDSTQARGSRVLTRDDGTYSFNRLPPGPFEIHVEPPSEDRETRGGDEPADMLQPLPWLSSTLGAGRRLTLEPLVLPSSFRTVRIEGIVHDAEGAPASDARVFLKGATTRPRILGEPAVTDSLGRFVLTVIEGTSYGVFAERQAADRRGTEFSDQLTFTAALGMSPVRLALRRRF